MLPLSRLSSKDSLIIKTLFFLVIVIGLFKLILLPLYSQNNTLSKEMQNKKISLVKYRQLLKRKDLVKKEYAKHFASYDIPKGEDPLVAAFRELENIAKKTSVKIIDIRQAQRDREESNELFIRLSLEAEKEAYIRFIYELRASPLLFSLKEFTLRTKGRTSFLQINCTISNILTF